MFKNFDFNWFITTPGILTLLGCLLIFISIIIFISSLSSGKKKDANPESNQSVDMTANTSMPVTETIAPDVASVTSDVAVNEETNVTPIVEPVSVEPVAVEPVPVTPEVAVNTEPVSVTPTVAPVSVEPTAVEPVAVTPEVAVNTEPASVTPTVAPVSVEPVVVEPVPVTPEVAVNTEPVSVTPTVEVAPTVAQTQVSPSPEVSTPRESTAINPIEITPESVGQQQNYSGINIEPTIMPVENQTTVSTEPSKTIYGGADPLAGTGVIQTVQSTTEKKDDIESL